MRSLTPRRSLRAGRGSARRSQRSRRARALDAPLGSRASDQRRAKLEGDYFEVDYADFVAWRAIGVSSSRSSYRFAMAALRGADGLFLLGEMAPHTTNDGQIYFPAGTPDPSDVFDGKVDLEASACRELLEETGVRAEEAIIGATWTVVFAGSRIACIKPMTLPLTADEAKARIEAFLAREARPELTRMHIVRRASTSTKRACPSSFRPICAPRSKAARATLERPAFWPSKRRSLDVALLSTQLRRPRFGSATSAISNQPVGAGACY